MEKARERRESGQDAVAPLTDRSYFAATLSHTPLSLLRALFTGITHTQHIENSNVSTTLPPFVYTRVRHSRDVCVHFFLSFRSPACLNPLRVCL